MDRALRNVNDVAAVTSNSNSGYPDLSNVQLAQEVQKLNGYNHFSSSTANLLEEVVRRLVCAQGTSVRFTGMGQSSSSNDPLDNPVAYGSTITMRDLTTAPYTVRINPRSYLKKSVLTNLGKQLNKQGLAVHQIDDYLSTLKQCYNVTSICKMAPGNFDVVFYYLANGSMYWTWCSPEEVQTPVNKFSSETPGPEGNLS